MPLDVQGETVVLFPNCLEVEWKEKKCTFLTMPLRHPSNPNYGDPRTGWETRLSSRLWVFTDCHEPISVPDRAEKINIRFACLVKIGEIRGTGLYQWNNFKSI